jgi:hypothetical protein
MSLGSLLGGLMDTEGTVRTTIENTLDALSEELQEENYKNFHVVIQPINEDFNFVCLVYHIKSGQRTMVREIPLKEILGGNK